MKIWKRPATRSLQGSQPVAFVSFRKKKKKEYVPFAFYWQWDYRNNVFIGT
jgi:hypothetical protein